MKLKYSQDWQVYEIAKKLVLCRIKVLPRKSHKSSQSNRWMYPKEWLQFEDSLEHALSETTTENRKFLGLEDDCEKQFCIDSTISVRIKKLKENTFQKVIEQDYGVKKFDLVIECDIEYIRIKSESKESLLVLNEGKSDMGLERQLKKKKLKYKLKQNEKSSPEECQSEIVLEKTVTSRLSSEKIKDKAKKEQNQTPRTPILGKSNSNSHERNRGSTKKRRLVDCETEKTLINNWLKKDQSTNDVENNNAKTCKSMKHKSKKANKTSPNKEKNERRILLESQQLEKNLEMTNMLRGMLKPVPENFKYLTLEKMSAKELVNTLEEWKNVLDDIFAENKTEMAVRGNDGVDHYLVINLISSQKQLDMMNRLSDEYKCDNATLLANILLPEWLLRIFMQRYKLSREDAIDQIKKQEEFQIHSLKRKKSDLDLMSLQSVKKF